MDKSEIPEVGYEEVSAEAVRPVIATDDRHALRTVPSRGAPPSVRPVTSRAGGHAVSHCRSRSSQCVILSTATCSSRRWAKSASPGP